MKILFLVPYPKGTAASQRFRFEQYLSILDKHGFQCEFKSFLNPHEFHTLYQPGQYFNKLSAVLRGFMSRLTTLFKIQKFDLIFIHREVTPIGPPVFEYVICKWWKKPVIYDFDDAIWISEKQSYIRNFFKFYDKTGKICRWSSKISCGNEFLAEFARRFNHCPTTVDLNYHKPCLKKNEPQIPVVGWTGSHSTLPYLNMVIDILRKVRQEIPFLFYIIADQNPSYPDSFIEWIRWEKENEIDQLSKLDIGIMPLPSDEWSKGKCGFKIIQYFALGIPAIASPVGENLNIVQHGVNGLLAKNFSDWENYLKLLLKDHDLRNKMGINGYKLITEKYSISANNSKYLKLFSLNFNFKSKS